MEERKEEGNLLLPAFVPTPPATHPCGRPADWRKKPRRKASGDSLLFETLLRTRTRTEAIYNPSISKQAKGWRKGGSCGGRRKREKEREAGRLPLFSSWHTLWRRCIKESACCGASSTPSSRCSSYRISLFIFGGCWDPGEEQRPTPSF